MKGFTLLELLCAIAVLAILTLVALPNGFRQWQQHRLHVFSDALCSLINDARLMAMLTHHDVLICGSGGHTCDGHWQQGVLLQDSDGLFTRFVPNSGHFKMTFADFRQNDRLIFSPDPLHLSVSGHIDICLQQSPGVLIDSVIISPFGRVRVSQSSTYSC